MKSCRTAITVAGTWIVAAGAIAQEPTDGKPPAAAPAKKPVDEQHLQQLMQKEHDALAARQGRIDAELAALDRAALKDEDWAKEWAGSYYTGDGLGMNVGIKVAPRSGLTYQWHGCMGLYDANHGDIVGSFPGGLNVKLAIDENASHYHFMAGTLYFVRWGDRRYLVPEPEMLKLINNYNEGGFARESMYDIPLKYERDEQVHRRRPMPAGRPQLPEKYAKLLLDRSVVLKVTKVTPRPERPVTTGVKVLEARVDLQGGKDAGAFEGMSIRYSKGSTFGSIDIFQVSEKSCSGRLTIFGGDGKDLELPEPGMELRFPEPPPEGEPDQPAPQPDPPK